MTDSPNGFTARNRRRLIAAGAAAAVLVGGGAALAATQPWSPKQENQAVINDAAGRLGVAPQKLSDALTQALMDRIDQAVTNGQLSKQQGDALKARIKAGDLPMFAPGRGPGDGMGEHHGFGGRHVGMDAAAAFLGLTVTELRQQQMSGKTLEQIAKDKGKTTADLAAAMKASVQKSLDDAVSRNQITKAQETQMLTGVDQMIQHEITENEANEHHGGFDGGPGSGAVPGGTPPASPWGSGTGAPAPGLNI
jgi:hypothetical protein